MMGNNTTDYIWRGKVDIGHGEREHGVYVRRDGHLRVVDLDCHVPVIVYDDEAEPVIRAAMQEIARERDRQKLRAEQAYREVAEGLDRERALRDQLAVVKTDTADVWCWQGDGHDDPASLTCPVVMSAHTLRELLARAEKAEARAGAEQELRMAQDAEATAFAMMCSGVVTDYAPLYEAQDRVKSAREALIDAGGTP